MEPAGSRTTDSPSVRPMHSRRDRQSGGEENIARPLPPPHSGSRKSRQAPGRREKTAERRTETKTNIIKTDTTLMKQLIRHELHIFFCLAKAEPFPAALLSDPGTDQAAVKPKTSKCGK